MLLILIDVHFSVKDKQSKPVITFLRSGQEKPVINQILFR